MVESSRAARVSSSRLIACLVCLFVVPAAKAADPFEDRVLPFLKTYCVECHNAKKASGELDLTRYQTASKIIEDFRQWEHVVSFLKKEEMPPAKAKKQPTAGERAAILATLEQVLFAEAKKLAGDPGDVLPRRLSNAEFDNTIRDLTGVDIRPAATFPLDPASGEGFNNTGEALTMSPSLFKKYYAAAQHVADHVLITSQGLKFAPHPVVTFADRQKFYEQQILKFYDDHKIDYETYFEALQYYQYGPPKQHIGGLAHEKKLSEKYLQNLWMAIASNKKDDYFLGWLRDRWKAIPPPKAPGHADAIRALASDVRNLSMRLTPPETPAIVANAGNGPVEHLDRRRRTASARDTFDPNAFARQRISYQYGTVGEKPTIKLVIQIADTNTAKADGLVVIHGGFTNSNPETAKLQNDKKNWSLRAILEEFAPDKAKELNFGVHPSRKEIHADAFVLKAPAVLEIDVPTQNFNKKNGINFLADCRLEGSTHGLVYLRALERRPTRDDVARPALTLFEVNHADAAAIRASAEEFCRVFPNRFYYVDSTRGLSAGFHLIEGVFRDDQPLCKLVLSNDDKAELDRLWKEMLLVTDMWHKMLRGFVFFERSERSFLNQPAFDWVKEEDPLLTNDAHLAKFKDVYLLRSNVKLTGEELKKHPIDIFFEDIRNGLKFRAMVLKKLEPYYLKNIEDFASRAFRRPLTEKETEQIRKFFSDINNDENHGLEVAVRASITRILVSPHFCYHVSPTIPGDTVAPIGDLALASRLSYFLWAGPPDAELLSLARAGKLQDEKVLREQTRRMLKDEKVSRFALEFFGQWFGYREFLKQEAVNRKVFPMFDDALRQAMFEEPTRLATHLLQENRPITELINGDSTFVNKKLAMHYGVPYSGESGEWERIDGLSKLGRGGVMGMAVFLTKNSQPQRTSPVKRGFWVVHKLLGEHIPPPPNEVAPLPPSETETKGKTIRELLVLHTNEAHCARCHVRFDGAGLAMEGFDPVGKARTKDLAGRPIDNVVHLPSGQDVRGVPEFSKYLMEERKRDFAKTLTQKLLGYALGRSLALSDHTLLDQMQTDLDKNYDRLLKVFETVVTSPQFRNQRCRDFSVAAFTKKGNGQ